MVGAPRWPTGECSLGPVISKDDQRYWTVLPFRFGNWERHNCLGAVRQNGFFVDSTYRNLGYGVAKVSLAIVDGGVSTLAALDPPNTRLAGFDAFVARQGHAVRLLLSPLAFLIVDLSEDVDMQAFLADLDPPEIEVYLRETLRDEIRHAPHDGSRPPSPTPTVSTTSSWLQPAERDYFAAMGLLGDLDGMELSRPYDPAAIHEAARRIGGPLGAVFKKAGRPYEAPPSPKGGDIDGSGRALSGVFAMGAGLAAEDLDEAVDAINRGLREGAAAETWKGSRERMEDRTERWNDEKLAFATIAESLIQRSPPTRPDISWSAVPVGPRVGFVGKLGGTSIGQSLVRITIVPKSEVQSGDDMIASAVARVAGVDAVAVDEGAKLEVTKRRAASSPKVRMALLPPLAPGSTISVLTSLMVREATRVDHLEVVFFSDHGTLPNHELAGLNVVQRASQRRPLDLSLPPIRLGR